MSIGQLLSQNIFTLRSIGIKSKISHSEDNEIG